MQPTPEAPGKTVRRAHRKSLIIHFLGMVGGLGGLALANRAVSPGLLWVHWAALVWGVVFVAHLLHFERGTMATMGRKTR